MKAKISRSERFDININGTLHCGFKVKSEWNGLVEYENKDGKVIATNEFENDVFSFLMTKPETEGEAVIVKAAPFFCKTFKKPKESK